MIVRIGDEVRRINNRISNISCSFLQQRVISTAGSWQLAAWPSFWFRVSPPPLPSRGTEKRRRYPNSSERPDFHYYESGNVHVVVNSPMGYLAIGMDTPGYRTAAEQDADLDTARDPLKIPSGTCDAISFSPKDAIQKAASYVERFKLPVDLSLPRVNAYQWYDLQYYEIIFEQLLGGIPAYTNSFASTLDVPIDTRGYVCVRVCQDGIYYVAASLTQNAQPEVDTCCGPSLAISVKRSQATYAENILYSYIAVLMIEHVRGLKIIRMEIMLFISIINIFIEGEWITNE